MMKLTIAEKANEDNQRGDYIAFGQMHWASFILGACTGGLVVYSVWFFQSHF